MWGGISLWFSFSWLMILSTFFLYPLASCISSLDKYTISNPLLICKLFLCYWVYEFFIYFGYEPLIVCIVTINIFTLSVSCLVDSFHFALQKLLFDVVLLTDHTCEFISGLFVLFRWSHVSFLCQLLFFDYWLCVIWFEIKESNAIPAFCSFSRLLAIQVICISIQISGLFIFVNKMPLEFW